MEYFLNFFENVYPCIQESPVKSPKHEAVIQTLLICNKCPKTSSVIVFVDQNALDNHIKKVHETSENDLNELNPMPDFFPNMIKKVEVLKKPPTNIKVAEKQSNFIPNFYPNMIKVALSRFSWCHTHHAQIFLLKTTKNLAR